MRVRETSANSQSPTGQVRGWECSSWGLWGGSEPAGTVSLLFCPSAYCSRNIPSISHLGLFPEGPQWGTRWGRGAPGGRGGRRKLQAMQTHLWLQHQSGSVAQKVIGGDSEEEGRGRGRPASKLLLSRGWERECRVEQSGGWKGRDAWGSQGRD